MTRRRAALAWLALTLLPPAVAGSFGACEDENDHKAASAAGAGGAGGCPTAPEAMFTINVHAMDGAVPPDTTVRIAWSAGKEPTFALDDPTTWKTLDEANLVCGVTPGEPPPVDLPVLVCWLWTTGATHVEVSAKGYEDFEDTLTPAESEKCEGFLPRSVDIQLVRAADGGRE